MENPSANSAKDNKRLYSIFTHPHRGKIIELLQTKRSMGFTELKAETKVGTGTLYYHLSVLGELVEQGKDKRYMLTENGRLAYQLLTEGPNVSQPIQALDLTGGISPYLSGTMFFQYMNRSPLIHLSWCLGIMLVGGWAAMLGGLRPLALFLLDSKAPTGLESFLYFVAGWLLIALGCIALSTVLFGKREGNLGLAASIAFAYIPLTIFSILWLMVKTSFPDSLGTNEWFFRILFFGLQGWSLVLLASALKVSKGLSTARSSMTVLGLVYLNAMVVIIGI